LTREGLDFEISGPAILTKQRLGGASGVTGWGRAPRICWFDGPGRYRHSNQPGPSTWHDFSVPP